MSLTILALVIISSISSKESSERFSSKSINNNVVVLDKTDALKINNPNASQQQKESPNKRKANAIAAKWATINKSEMNYKPFHVKKSGENIPNWKSYLVLMMGEKENYLLKKVCFSTDNSTFGVVLDSNNSCKNEVFF